MSDCIVIGGGINGLMSAKYLAQAGAKVTLIEQQACGQESSWAGGGIISPLYPWQYDDLTNDLSFASQAVYEDLCQDLMAATGIDPEYRKSGLLMMDEYDSQKAKVWLSRYNIGFENHPKGALFSHVAQVRNPRLLKALKADILNRDVQIIENTKVVSLIDSHQKISGVQTQSQKYNADYVILTAGAWSSELTKLPEDVFPVKGQMIVIKHQPDAITHIIIDQGRYIIPRADGRILVGSTMENVGFDRTLDETTKESLHRFAIGHFPELLSDSKVEHHWSGFRPGSKSGKVLLKRDHRFKNLLINTGHFRNGLNMAPACAKQILDWIKHE